MGSAPDERAWKHIYDDHVDAIYAAAKRLGMSSADAEDVVQEVFLVAFRRFETYHGGSMKNWLYRICANLVANRHRRRRVTERFNERFSALGVFFHLWEPRSPEQAVQANQAQAALQRVLARMSPKKREVFALYELEGLDAEVIAERVSCPVPTVWTRLHHARKEFQTLAVKLGYTEPA